MANKNANKEVIKATNAYPGERLVRVKIPLISEDDGDVFVSVNDRNWYIKRGAEVEIPECAAEVLEHREQCLGMAIEYCDRAAGGRRQDKCMTLREALDRADSLHPGSVPEAERIAWLDSIDRTVCAEITGGEFGGYTVDSPADTELLVPPPYDELYLHVLEARSAYVGGEIDRYNNATALLQNLWEAYARSYIRSHRPTRRELNYLGGDRI